MLRISVDELLEFPQGCIMGTYQSRRKTMADIHPLLDKEAQKKARRYEKEKRLLGFADMLLFLAVLLIFYFSGLSERLANLDIGGAFAGTFLLYAIVLYGLITALGLPLAYFSGYVHEHKWHFSNHTIMSWLWEQLKSFLVGLILFLFLLGLLLWIMTISQDWWWLTAAIAMTFVSVILAAIFPVVIAPIFNKYTPIEDRELTTALDRLLASAGLKSGGFFKEDMSRQTKKENASLAGLGRTRRVILGDNLLGSMTIPEVESIIAHEIGHFKYRHIWKNIAAGTVQQLAVFFIVHSVMIRVSTRFLSSVEGNLSLVPVLAVLLGGVSVLVFAPINNALSRVFEKQADRYALENIKDKRPFITALAGLANRNLSNAYPEWWVKCLYYSHPPIGERLELAESHTPPCKL
jgi:STE24 endopeptidase